jgi:hypothetical protein
MQNRRIVLVADMTPVKEEEEHITPWGRVWTHGANVMATWRRHGFVPPTEYRDDFMFKVNREGGLVND